MSDVADLPLKGAQRSWAVQADHFAMGRWTPLEVFDAYTRRIMRLNPVLNAVLDTRFEAAREQAADSADRWARGAPLSEIDGAFVMVKANIAVEGLPWHAGIKAYERHIAKDDAACVAALKRAGAVVAGTVNMEEGALGAVTDNPWYGRTLNPWGKAGEALTPGGSSGGSGAAVAAGLCVMALGTDTMGSVRIPAAYCGVAALKPSRGLISTDGVIALSTTLDHVGPLTRSARDLPAFVSVLSGVDEQAERGLAGLRIGRWRFEDHLQADIEVAAAFERALEQLAKAGATIVDVHAKAYEYGRTRRRGLLISEIEGHHIHADAMEASSAGFSEHFRRLLEWGAGQPVDKARSAYDAVAAVPTDAEAWFADVDLVVSPTALEPAFEFGAEIPAGQADLTAFADMAGTPAAAVPMGLSEAGRPLSLQLIAAQGSDGLALKAARQFEALVAGPLIPPGY